MIVAAGVIIGTLYISNRYIKDDNKKPTVYDCPNKGSYHIVEVLNNSSAPNHTDAKLCDVLIITNKDNRVRQMAFGQHDEHQTYDGITEKILQKDESLTVTLNQLGTYLFHDHIGDVARGNFTVTE